MPSLALPDGTRIFHEVAGSGPALVFAHGLGGNHLSWWQQIPAFARNFTCVAFAHRGFAPSSASGGGVEPERFADDLEALLAHLGVAEFSLVAQSMGGWTALLFALRQPRRLRALVLSATTGIVDPRALLRPALGEHERWTRWAAAECARFEAARIHPAAGERMAREQPELHHLYCQVSGLSDALDRGALRARLMALRTEDLAVLAPLAMPVLCVSGLEDVVIDPSAVRALAAALPNARFEAFEATGHSPYFERASRFNAVLEQFLAEAHAGRGA